MHVFVKNATEYMFCCKWGCVSAGKAGKNKGGWLMQKAEQAADRGEMTRAACFLTER
ncbi:MAG: hypothetical protein HDT27_09985 [Subdoligranulum sp.]|nr:hypothetical protein [Subdoligranulum sp.]